MKKLTVIFSLLAGMAFLDMSAAMAQMCPAPNRGSTSTRTRTTTTTTRTRTSTDRNVRVRPRRRTSYRFFRSVCPTPSRRTTFINGFYIKTGNGYQWRSGYSTPVVNNRVWIPECYKRERGSWVYVPGRWKYVG